MATLTVTENMLKAPGHTDTAMDIIAHEAETELGTERYLAVATTGEIESIDRSIAHGHDPHESIENQNTTDLADEDPSRYPDPQTQLPATKPPKNDLLESANAPLPQPPPPLPTPSPLSSAPHHPPPHPRSAPAAAAPSLRRPESTTVFPATTTPATTSTRTPTARTTGTKRLKRCATGRNGNSRGRTG